MSKRTNYIINKKWLVKILLLFIIVLFTSGCGEVKSKKSLYKWAKNEYGDCTIVSMTETDDKTVVVLHDTLQDFESEKDEIFNNIVIISDRDEISTTNEFEKNIENVLSENNIDINTNIKNDLWVECYAKNAQNKKFNLEFYYC